VTKIKFSLPSNPDKSGQTVNLVIFDITGKEITTLLNKQLKSGSYEVIFDGSNLPSGVYFYKFTAGESQGLGTSFTETKKMLLIK